MAGTVSRAQHVTNKRARTKNGTYDKIAGPELVVLPVDKQAAEYVYQQNEQERQAPPHDDADCKRVKIRLKTKQDDDESEADARASVLTVQHQDAKVACDAGPSFDVHADTSNKIKRSLSKNTLLRPNSQKTLLNTILQSKSGGAASICGAAAKQQDASL